MENPLLRWGIANDCLPIKLNHKKELDGSVTDLANEMIKSGSAFVAS